jgi:anthranilate phosphoribosyltransferase
MLIEQGLPNCPVHGLDFANAYTVDTSCPTWFPELLGFLLERRNLSASQMRTLLEGVFGGSCGEVETAALLIALRAKGETAGEIAAAARVLREHMVHLDLGREGLLDTSGTGGDGAGTFNISTAAALVAAGAGVPVVKHGNRAVSGSTGSADVLVELGVRLHEGVAWPRRCLERAGIAFCFAPFFHPALARVAATRRRLRVRTLFNCLGPLVNPAGAMYQIIGVGRAEWLDPIAGALAELGTRHAFLVSSRDGLDEVSLSAPTLVREVRGHTVTATEWTPADFRLQGCTAAQVAAPTARASAAMIAAVLAGSDGPARRMVLANSAAALLAAERVGTLAEGVQLAAETIDSGRARQVLQRLVDCDAE